MQTTNELYYSADIQVIRETTDWDIPNHTYYINRAEKMVAYISRTGEKKVFKKPLSFSRSGRKFHVMKDFGYPRSGKYKTTASSCTCLGFLYRKQCKHVKAYNKKV